MAAPRKDNIKEKILQATTELLKTTALADISLAEIAAAAALHEIGNEDADDEGRLEAFTQPDQEIRQHRHALFSR